MDGAIDNARCIITYLMIDVNQWVELIVCGI